MKNPVPLAIIGLGCFAMLAAAFLPYVEPGRLDTVEGNTVIQSADGWRLIVSAAAIFVCAYRADSGGKRDRVIALFMPWLGITHILQLWLNKDARTVYPTGIHGMDAPGTVASLGIGFYLAAVGVTVAVAGTTLLWEATKPQATNVIDDELWDDDDEPSPQPTY
ncbi:hypothetical protein BST33_11105 [Mycolicibacter minnesotensis]|uniref:Uncharacterized protein n=1 Tax=Mycolicibacter minnesotensis TaxID=1118379 RepID=A0A7I7R3N8_9MYCO|nr:hypothetical protein [Mycolicibacter minnesotensis]ORB00520.1 hypothetical protein BST33_11105 [Mycolicibacter minnesotensis]BBY33238.1 hypothetical protein MMIN_12990 [Mycolicibacter minnesotensis]